MSVGWHDWLVAGAMMAPLFVLHAIVATLLTRKDRVRALALKDLIREQDAHDAKYRSPSGRVLGGWDVRCGRGHNYQLSVSQWVMPQLKESGFLDTLRCPWCEREVEGGAPEPELAHHQKPSEGRKGNARRSAPLDGGNPAPTLNSVGRSA